MILVDVTGNQSLHLTGSAIMMSVQSSCKKRMASRYLFQNTTFPLSLSLRRVLQRTFDRTFIEHFTGFKGTTYIDVNNLGRFDLISLTENPMSQNHDFIKLTRVIVNLAVNRVVFVKLELL